METEYTTIPLPFNIIFPEGRGAIRAVNKVLHYGGYKLVGTIIRSDTKKSKEIASMMEKAERLGEKLV